MIRKILTAALLAAPIPVHAQEASGLSVELNAMDEVPQACRLVFVARNGTAADVASLVVEAVAFDANGNVAQMSLFDFGALPAGLPRVRQFDLGGLACADLGSVLINGVQSCGTTDEAEAEACPLTVSSRVDVELLG